jgi:hypothetical protein
MPTYAWVLIVIGIILAWYVWNKYGAIYTAIKNNPNAVHAGLAVNRYATDITGLVGAYDAADSDKGSFTSRMGAFFGTLPT